MENKFVEEETKTKSKIEEGKTFVKKNRGYFMLAGAFLAGLYLGNKAGVASQKKTQQLLIDAAKAEAKEEMIHELISSLPNSERF